MALSILRKRTTSVLSASVNIDVINTDNDKNKKFKTALRRKLGVYFDKKKLFKLNHIMSLIIII